LEVTQDDQGHCRYSVAFRGGAPIGGFRGVHHVPGQQFASDWHPRESKTLIRVVFDLCRLIRNIQIPRFFRVDLSMNFN
jgi:hypothetical protein